MAKGLGLDTQQVFKTCLLLHIEWGFMIDHLGWADRLFGSFIVLFSPREEQLMLTCEFFSSKLELHPWVTFIFCIIFLCARCSWWRQWETWPKEAVIFLLLNFGPSVLSCCYLLFFENSSTSVLLFNFIIGSNPFLTF